jgi:mono/diheme cytochrome c family protein
VTPPNTPPEEPFNESETENEINVAGIHGSILREREEPRDGYEPIPLWLISVFFAVIFWAGIYLAYNSGGFQDSVFNPQLVAWQGGGAAADKGPPDPMVVGKRLYTQNCVVCHQTSGLGVAGQFPPLVESEWVVDAGSGDWVGDNHLVKILLHGLQGAIQVKGNTYNNAMPPWQQLKDSEIAYILTYIRSEWGNNEPPITEEYVASIRALHPDRSDPWVQSELQAIPAELIEEAASSTPPADEVAPDAPPAEAPAA